MDDTETKTDFICAGYSQIAGDIVSIVGVAISVVWWFGGAIVDMVNSERMQRLAIDLLWLHSRGMIQLEKFGQWTYDEFEYVKYCVDNITWLKEQSNRWTSRAKTEPISVQWVQSCKLISENKTPNHYFEHSQNVQEGGNLFDAYNAAMQSISATSDCTNGVVIMKRNERYFVRSCNTNATNHITEEDEWEKSDFQPMSISYSHPSMEEPVAITLPVGMWCVGNQILSPIFIRRCLEYQEQPFIFDGKYSIQIIDSNVNVYSIHPHEYICVQKCGIDIRSILAEENEYGDVIESEHADEKVDVIESEHADEKVEVDTQ